MTMYHMGLAFVLVACATSTASLDLTLETQAREAFANFCMRFGRHYATDEEQELRFRTFRENVVAIEAANVGDQSFTLGVGPFADWTPEEFRRRRLGGFQRLPASNRSGMPRFEAPTANLPSSVDWTANGAVTPVQDQGDCGDCWAFATTGTLEGAFKVSTGKLTKLSEQMLVSCDTYASGCTGGGADLGVWWVEENGLCSETDYPYTSGASGKVGSCKSCSSKAIASGAVSDFSYVGETEAALQAAVAQMPVAVGIEADKAPVQHYKSGVITGTDCGTNLDHNVLVVGYGELDGTKYWKVKNSWGPAWGMDGYFLIERGASGKGGECGILTSAVVPVLSKNVIV